MITQCGFSFQLIECSLNWMNIKCNWESHYYHHNFDIWAKPYLMWFDLCDMVHYPTYVCVSDWLFVPLLAFCHLKPVCPVFFNVWQQQRFLTAAHWIFSPCKPERIVCEDPSRSAVSELLKAVCHTQKVYIIKLAANVLSFYFFLPTIIWFTVHWTAQCNKCSLHIQRTGYDSLRLNSHQCVWNVLYSIKRAEKRNKAQKLNHTAEKKAKQFCFACR